ncbi:nitrate reductase [Gemmobacter lanyuensis]|uniref:Nitrate reductase n=1 Tax=Gemmobacter lanyuensis TaxID=1054497 RepID=A0A918IW21_9RHOB|nr:4Fe-4S dicluster domain-containing protein [Gemmobacter lanyuensis]GGW34750.1 nitrate reductase [Gemmobacter lanyuensis]
MTASRRQFLTGRVAKPAPEFRPPWTSELRLAQHCTACGDCAPACPEGIIEIKDGRPRIRLNGAACSFCGACATACTAGAFDRDQPEPWPVRVEVGPSCLLAAGIACQLCTDACDSAALRIDLRVRPVGAIRIDAAACTGCGACLAVCPGAALQLRDDRLTQRGT